MRSNTATAPVSCVHRFSFLLREEYLMNTSRSPRCLPVNRYLPVKACGNAGIRSSKLRQA